MIYLASLYTLGDTAENVKDAQYHAGILLGLGLPVYSPVVHGHHIRPYVREEFRNSHPFWMRHCLDLLSWSDFLIVLTHNELWKDSVGIRMEIELAEKIGIPTIYWDGTVTAAAEIALAIRDSEIEG